MKNQVKIQDTGSNLFLPLTRQLSCSVM